MISIRLNLARNVIAAMSPAVGIKLALITIKKLTFLYMASIKKPHVIVATFLVIIKKR